jgi:hypothetical protein
MNHTNHRHLTEVATPEQVARTNELLATVRLHWRLAAAWERKDPGTLTDSDLSPDNPYAADYTAALAAYHKHRSES